MTSSLTPFKWISAARDVYDQYLSQGYTNSSCEDDWVYRYDDPGTGTQTIIQRPNHGLAHALRTASYVPYVVEIYNAVNKTAISSSEVENIQLATLFYVTGRQNEVGHTDNPTLHFQFHQRSATFFEKYVRENLPYQLTGEKFSFYRTAVLNPYAQNPPQYIILRICHDLDLLRCYSKQKYAHSLQTIANYIGGPSTDKLAKIAKECLIKTGDRILCEQRSYDGPLFTRCSTNVYFCLHQIKKVMSSAIMLSSPPLHPTSQPNVEELLTLLCQLFDHQEIRQHAQLMKVLDAKVKRLLTLPDIDPLDTETEKFFKLAKRLITQTKQINQFALGLLLKTADSETTEGGTSGESIASASTMGLPPSVEEDYNTGIQSSFAQGQQLFLDRRQL